jgi:pilus assembly protein CpaC
MNGQQASFLAGGEFPVPVVQGGSTGNAAAVSVIFKEYGVRLTFKPTILDEDHIRLELEPEVSTLDFANGVRLNGFIIPALRTRRAHTGIELRDGQSFALAGLLDNSETRNYSKVPGLGDLPILGNLFRSKSFQQNESELMFIVTTHVVHPVNRDDLPAMPAVDSLKKGSPLGITTPLNKTSKQSGETNDGSGQSGYITEPATTTEKAAPANGTNKQSGDSGYITEPATTTEKAAPAPVTRPVTAPAAAPVKSGSPVTSGPATKSDGSPAKPETSTNAVAAQKAKTTPDKP